MHSEVPISSAERAGWIAHLERLAFALLERGLAAGDTDCLKLFWRIKGQLSRAPGRKRPKRKGRKPPSRSWRSCRSWCLGGSETPGGGLSSAGSPRSGRLGGEPRRLLPAQLLLDLGGEREEPLVELLPALVTGAVERLAVPPLLAGFLKDHRQAWPAGGVLGFRVVVRI